MPVKYGAWSIPNGSSILHFSKILASAFFEMWAVMTVFTKFNLCFCECVFACQCLCLSRCTVVGTTCAPGSWPSSKCRQSCRRMNQACVHQTWGVPPPLTKHTKTLAPGTGPHPVYPLSCPSHTPLPAALCLLQEEEVPRISFSRYPCHPCPSFTKAESTGQTHTHTHTHTRNRHH